MVISNRLTTERNSLQQAGSHRLPKLSLALDSVRVYQFEVQFTFPEGAPNSNGLKNMSVAAKSVGAGGPKVEVIEAHRLNDRYFYPGKANMDELKITFDNILKTKAGANLFAWFRACTYDPLTGYTSPIQTTGSFKAEKLRVIEYDGTMTPISYVDYIGVFPTHLSLAEHNYTQNEFHTIECTFKYDFIDIYASTIENNENLVQGIFPS